MRKKAMVAIQFHWIFILIVGALIMVFAGNVVVKQSKLSEMKLATSILMKIEGIISGAEVSTGTASVVDLSGNQIKFDCLGCDCKYSISGLFGSPSKSFRGGFIFAPKLIKGGKMGFLALDWNVPYRVSNFLYLTGDDMRYIVVYDSNSQSLLDEIKKVLPDGKEEGFNVEYVENAGDIKYLNNYKTRFVFLNIRGEVELDPSFKGQDVSGVEIIGYENYGTLDFYEFDKNNHEFKNPDVAYYLGLPSLIAAIYIDDHETYQCNMERAFEKLGYVTQIYELRTKTLNALSSDINCESIYEATYDSGNPFSEINDNIDHDNGVKIKTVYDNAFGDGLQRYNQRALLLSCPEIY